MNKTIFLEPNKVPSALRGGYTGKKFKAEVCENMTIPQDAGLWFEGSRTTYKIVRLSDGQAQDAVNHNASPWNNTRKDIPVQLVPGIAVVAHSIFCGKDMGLKFYVHPSDVADLLPAPQEPLSVNARQVLKIIKSYKSAYRQEYYDACKLTKADIETAFAELLKRGFITRNGAITFSGKNMIDNK